jgi:hypothetical protein
MSEFWGFPGAHILALIVITALAFACLYQARRFVTKL